LANIDVAQVPQFVPTDEVSQTVWNSTKQVYTLRQFQPAWFTEGDVRSKTEDVLQTLENASQEGLDPENFAVADLRMMWESLKVSADSKGQSDFDLHLTYSVARYASQLCFGRINPPDINPDWPKSEKNCDVAQIVADAIEKNTVKDLAEQLSPKLPAYQGLKALLQRYREIAAHGGWQPVSADAGKKRRVPESAVLAENLVRMGDLAAPDTDETVSSKTLSEALRQFQLRHGLEPDGRLGEKTVRAMNVPVEQRIEQIKINLDRMRWSADRFEPRHVRVNVPAFELSVHDDDQVPLQMRAIVGSFESPTPILDDQIEYLVFSPYWNVPLSIATKELLPKIKKDRAYLRREQIEVVRVSGDKVQVLEPSKVDWDKAANGQFELRQKPGASNALGLVKFIFPNPYEVYLHDTPSDNLFDRLTRTLSHGCIRIERPAELAAYLLQDQPEWTPDRIEEAMHAEKEKRVPLKTKMPIHLLYWTAWAEADGKAQFREDVYSYDEKHAELTSSEANLPAAHATNIDMHEIRTRIVPDAAGFHGKRSLSQQR